MKLLQYRGIINGEWFSLIYDRKETPGITKTLQFYLDQFNIDDYYIYKSTRHQKEVSIEEFINFIYSGYMMCRKDKYKKENIDIWIDYFNNFGGIQYLSKPLPPYSPNKIIIKK